MKNMDDIDKKSILTYNKYSFDVPLRSLKTNPEEPNRRK